MAKEMAERLGIYAPYGWDDATYMAGGLFELATNVFGLPASYLTVATHEKGIHFKWDTQVLNGNRHGFKSWAGDCGHIVWFHIHPGKLETAIAMGCKNTLVALPHRLSAGDFPALGRFDKILCPTKALHSALTTRIYSQNDRIVHVPWDSGLYLNDKEGARGPGPLRLLVSLDSPTARAIGPMICCMLRVLMDGNPDVQVTVLYGKNWPRHSLMALHDLLDAYEPLEDGPQRVQAIKKPTFCQRIEAYKFADWVFCPSIGDNAGLVALEALSSGCPVISFNAPPFNEFLRPFHNACLANCQLDTTELGVPVIKPNARELLDTLCEAVENRSVLHMLRGRAWPELEERRRGFQAYWKKALAHLKHN